METVTYDVIIIGSGQAGTPLARAFASAGASTVLVEAEHVAGTCINEGCTPTKTMVASARIAHLVRRAADYGVQTGSIKVDLTKVRQRKRDVVESFRKSNERRLSDNHVELIMGMASFESNRTVRVDKNDGGSVFLEADRIIINTGARPRIPNIQGIEQVEYLTSTMIMELAEVPDHLIIIGGGYVGVEFGQMFRRFGSEVTIVQRSEQLLTREDEDVAKAVGEILEQDGIRLLLETNPVSVEQDSEGEIHLKCESGDELISVRGSHLLVAAGRVPNSESLNLEVAGVEADRGGHITVNDRLETNVPGIYAAGDVKGGPAFTHISYDDFRILKSNLIDGKPASIRDRMVPYVVFMDPQLGRIGINESIAKERNLGVKTAKIPMSWVARAIEVDETRGLMKAVVDKESDQILGFTMLGIDGGEIMAAVEIAMMGKLEYQKLRDGIFAHPTLAEALNTLFGAIEK